MPDVDFTIIDRHYEENAQLARMLLERGEISLLTVFETHFRKSLLLSVASFFEHRVKDAVVRFAESKSNNCVELVALIKNKAVERQYHTYFNWSTTNANSFLGLFGADFKSTFSKSLTEEINLSVRAFMELGNDRNSLVHENYANYFIEKTSEEIYAKYKEALQFIEYLELKLSQL